LQEPNKDCIFTVSKDTNLKKLEIMYTQKEIKEMEEFDYASLFNQEEVQEVEVEEVKVVKQYDEVKITPSSYDMRHHLARLSMMMAQERGEDLSYREAINL
jgi:hypothetical protein